jgi:uncharacterized surface protein with fasciclin (FAS1) repeats
VVIATAAAAVAIVVVVAAARSNGDAGGHSGRPDPPAGGGSSTATSTASTAAGPLAESGVPPALRGLVGSGCADYAAAVPSGAGSIPSMGAEGVSAALAANPLLSTFDQGLTGRLNHQVSLTGSLADDEFTVFAPIDSAFAKVPAASLQKVTLSAPALRKMLSHLIVRGQLAPSQVAGSHTTLAGDPITVTSASGQLAVGSAQVVCGGLRTANATIYLVDAVPSLRG